MNPVLARDLIVDAASFALLADVGVLATDLISAHRAGAFAGWLTDVWMGVANLVAWACVVMIHIHEGHAISWLLVLIFGLLLFGDWHLDPRVRRGASYIVRDHYRNRVDD